MFLLDYFEHYMRYDVGLKWTTMMRIEDALTAFGWFIAGISLNSYIWAHIMVRARKNWEIYREQMKDNDFAALKLTDLDGKAVFILNGQTAMEILDAVLSYFIIFFFPEKYSLMRNRKKLRKILYTIWIISGILAIIGIHP